VNADDLGLTEGVNDGIFDAHHHGILTSASLFANAPATTDAIRRLRVRPSLGIGCHLALVDGESTLPAARVPTLVGGDGRLRPSWKPFIADCLRGRVSLTEVEREIVAQVDRLRSEGIRLTHLDAHKHVHAYPPIFAIVVRTAARFGIGIVRLPFERGALEDVGHAAAFLNTAMWPWARRDRRVAAAHGVGTVDFKGRIHTGMLGPEVLSRIVRALEPGVTELMVHPGYVDDALRRSPTRLLASRAAEVRLLCAPETKALVREERVDLVRHDLLPHQPVSPRVSSVQRSLRHVS
jgi:predicted glycoside hydrolase/deacetylase ChbG (UPF0249 family)